MPTMRTAGHRSLGARAVGRLPAEQGARGDHARAHRPALPGAARADQLRDAAQPRAVPDDGRLHAARRVGGGARRDDLASRRRDVRGPRGRRAAGRGSIRRCSCVASAEPGRAGRFQGDGRRDRPRVRALHRRGVDRARVGRGARARRARDGRAVRSGRAWPARRTSIAPSTPRGRAVEGDWGKTPGTERARLLHALADAIVANRAELAELEARNVGKAISSVKAELHQAVENFRYYASAIATIGGPLESDRRLAALLLAEGARRRRGADRALELPADDGDVEARACARRRLLGRAQARSADAADGDPAGRARGRGRLPGGRDQRRPGRRARRPARTSCGTPASTRSRSRARRRRAARSCGSRPTR